MNTILTKFFTAPPFDIGEILRYSGSLEMTADIKKLIFECIDEIKDCLTYKVCYSHFPVLFYDDYVDLSFTQIKSAMLKKNLSQCCSVIIFAATIGLEIDRFIARYGKTAPSKALVFQAIGAERIEALCDEFENFIKQEYKNTSPRMSPGYEDFPIEVQKIFFRTLDPGRKIGLTLNNSMLMSPSKSVTAIIGISEKDLTSEKSNCSNCTKTNCTFRRKL